MEDHWARCIESSGQLGPNYWIFLAQRLADLATIREGAVVLDLGTYDGNVLLKAMSKAGERGYGVGIDICDGGLADGIAEAVECGLCNVAFAQMDAAHLGFPSETFDSVLANFVGWEYCFDFDRMEFTASDRRMAEIVRVLKPGGQVGIGTWIEQCDLEWIAKAIKRYLPQCGQATGEQVILYGKENPEGYEAILCSSGLHDIRIHVETTTFVTPDAGMWWRHMKQAARVYLGKMPEPERFQEQVSTDLREFQSSKGIHFDKTVAYAFGTKPRR